MIDSKEKIMEYIGILQQDSFQDATVRTKNGKMEITAKLVGQKVQKFKPSRAPYTRQFLRHMPTMEPNPIKAAHDHKSSSKNPPGGREAIPKTSRRSKRAKQNSPNPAVQGRGPRLHRDLPAETKRRQDGKGQD